MQVTKPQALGLQTRPIEYRKRFGLCITGALHVPFAQAERGTLWGEQSMWNFLGQEMATPMIDEGVSKLTSEFLVHGNAYPPAGGANNACAVRVRLGGNEKTVLVLGDRYWDGSAPSAPAPFEKMPLSWQNSYGGADFPMNPLGKGRSTEGGLRWLPNLELPQSRMHRSDQAIQPAAMGLLDVMHPQRVQYRGTYDASYLKEHAPGFAPDLDWRYFNLAPSDQWMASPLRGDEPFSLDNMHPTQPQITGRLPGLQVRVFATYQMADGSSKMREVPLRLTTVWFFPHAERCILLYHGLAEVSSDDGSDVTALLGAVERLGEVKTDEHYAQVLELRADPKMGAVHSLRDSDLLPVGLSTLDPAAESAQKVFAMDGLQADAQYVRAATDMEAARESVRATGRDPDAMGLKMPEREKVPTGDELAAYVEKQMQAAELSQWQSLDDALKQFLAAYDFAEKHKIDMSQLAHRGPPVFSAEAQLAELAKSVKPGTVDLRELYAKLIQKEQVERLGYLQSAHMQPPAAAMPAAQAASLRDEMRIAAAHGLKFFAGLDFTGADFSELDLRGMNFAGAWLEGVNFSKSNLSGADFSGAVLAHANLSQVVAVGTQFVKANLGRANFNGAVLDNANLTEATLMYCHFANTQFGRSILKGAQLLETTWGQADWTGIQATDQTFYKLDLRGMVLAQAELAGCNFVECDLSGVDLRGASLRGANFVTCKLDGALLQLAQAPGVVLVKGCSLTGANLSQANFAGANFGAADMTSAVLVKAVLDGANLSEAKVGLSDWRLASAKAALMRKTVLRGTRMAGVNLEGAILQHADLRGADLRHANLFGTDMSRVRLDGDVQFDHALLKRARTWPRLTPEQQAAAP